jgi:hypothetical protein
MQKAWNDGRVEDWKGRRRRDTDLSATCDLPHVTDH